MDKIIKNSYWLDYKYDPSEPLTKNIDVDIAIIGGGVTGISAAYYLSDSKLKVALIEKHTIASGSSGRSSGALVPGLGIDFWEHVVNFGEKRAALIYKETQNIIKDIATIINEQKIDCDFHALSSYYLPWDKKGEEIIRKEHEYTQKYGIDSNLMQRNEAFPDLMVSGRFKSSLRYGTNYESHALNPAKFLRGLAVIAKKRGVDMYENAPVLNIKSADSGFTIFTKNGNVTAKKLILATNTYLPSLARVTEKNYTVVPGFVIATEPMAENTLNAGKIVPKLIWDSRTDYGFIRVLPNGRVIMDGGAGIPVTRTLLGLSKTLLLRRLAQINDRIDDVSKTAISNLHKELLKFFPQLDKVKIEYAWEGNEILSLSRRPCIGSDPINKNLLYAFGYSWHGLPIGFLAGKLLGKMCTGEPFDDSLEFLNFLKPVNSVRFL